MLKNLKSPSLEIQFQEIISNQFIVPADVQLLRVGTFYHDLYGRIDVTHSILLSMKDNFERNVRKIDLAIDYMHDSENIAAGWIKAIDLRNDGSELWAVVEWTNLGKQKLAEKEFRYLSADFSLDYQDNETLIKHGATLLGAGLTNRPVVKGMAPVIELSEKSFEEIQNLMAQDESLNACVSSLIPDLIAQGHDQQQAIAIAYSKCGEKKMGEIETLKEDNLKLSEKVKTLEAKFAEMPMSPEEMISKMKELEALIESLKGENEGLLAEKKKLMEEKKLSELSAKFDTLMSEGKAVEAQRESFIAGDAMKFAELAQPVKLSEAGTKVIPQTKEITDAAGEIIKLAEKKIAEKSAKSMSEAISQVLSEHKELRTKYENET